MYGQSSALPPVVQTSNKKPAKLLDELNDDDEAAPATPNPSSEAQKPWLYEFYQYINSIDSVPNGMPLIKWWGVCKSLSLEAS